MNTSGKRVSAALDFLRAVYQDDNGKLVDPSVGDFLIVGELKRQDLVEIVHDMADLREYDVDAMRSWLRAAWEAEAGLSEGAPEYGTREDKIEQARRTVRMTQWVRESGLPRDEAMREISDRAMRGDPMPWDAT